MNDLEVEVAAYQNPDEIARIVRGAKSIAVVGLSSNVLRPSHFVAFYLQRHGYRVIPVNPRESEVLGERSYPSLADVPVHVDVVDVFRRPDAVPAIVEEAIAIGAGAIWLQFGVIDLEAARAARTAGLGVVMDRCMKVEHARYLGRMHWLGLNTDRISARRS
jgi:predicted CoA-binding protein